MDWGVSILKEIPEDCLSKCYLWMARSQMGNLLVPLLLLLLKLAHLVRLGAQSAYELVEGNKLLTEQGDGLFMALTDFGSGPKCCQLPVVNRQKMKNELFFRLCQQYQSEQYPKILK